MRSDKDQAYWERNQLILYMTKIFNSWIEKHPDEDKLWEEDWGNIVFVEFPEGLMCWHIHDDELEDFKHLDLKGGNSWDGTTTEEKYTKLRGRLQDKRTKERGEQKAYT